MSSIFFFSELVFISKNFDLMVGPEVKGMGSGLKLGYVFS